MLSRISGCALADDTHLGACLVFLGMEFRISSKSISLYLGDISAPGFGIHQACRNSEVTLKL